MTNKWTHYLWALLAGFLGLFMTFILMNSFSKPLTVILAAVVFLFLGLVVGHLPLRWFWLGWVLLAAPVLISFGQITLGDSQLTHSKVNVLRLTFALLAAIPPMTGLAGMFWGKYTRKAEQLGEQKTLFQQVLSALANALLPVGSGFLGMFAVMFLNFMGYFLLQEELQHSAFPFIVYALVFGLIAGLLSYYRGNWLANSLLVCAFPVLYFMLFIPLSQSATTGQTGADAHNLLMLRVIPFTVAVALLAGYWGGRWRMRRLKSQ